MKLFLKILLFFVLMQGSYLFSQNAGNTEISYILSDESLLTIHGTSTINNFTIRANSMSGSLTVDISKQHPDEFRDISISGGIVYIPTDSLDTGGGAFNRHLRKTLVTERYPEILFRLREFRTENRDAGRSGWQTVYALGDVTVKGVTLKHSMRIRGRWQQGGRMEFAGETQFRMSDFGIKPPVLFLGLLRTGDTVTVRFHVYLRAAGVT